ncbi:MAG: hypothetical protein HY290_08230 [Planctomycetia bacterium]|nr:hypothetical protein [Planctomycetia bacterium]
MSRSTQHRDRTGRLANWIVAACACLVAASPVRSEERKADAASAKPLVEITIPSIDHAYQDFKLLFDLAHDQKGYKTFKETLDEFLVGVDAGKPCEVRTFVTSDGLSTVVSAPIADKSAFQKFLINLWDLDVKTAPPPAPQLQKAVPRSVQERLRTEKPQPQERILFGLTEGALRYDAGAVHLGNSLAAVRLAPTGTSSHKDKESSASLSIRMDGESSDPARRRSAVEKSRDDLLSRPKREKFESQAKFELAKSFADLQLERLERLLADSAQASVDYTVSRDKKTSKLEGEVVPVADTPLAHDVAGLGRHSDAFSGVSQQNAVVSAQINLPLDSKMGELLKRVAANARAAADEAVDKSTRLDAAQKESGKDLSELVFEIAKDVAGTDSFNSFLRTWTDTEGKLTTVGGTRIAHVETFRERIRKFKHQERVQKSIAGVELHKLTHAHWQADAPELFDWEGTVYVATSDHAIWYALGPEALERLEQAIQAAPQGAASGGANAVQAAGVDFHARLQPLARIWDAISSRRAPRSATRGEGRTEAKADPKAPKKSGKQADSKEPAKTSRKKTTDTVSASSIAGLQLHKIAAQAFKDGDGQFSLSLTRDGDKARLSINCDEGILRFAGMVLSKFTQENLSDEP